jgi:hypothetical protein
MRLWGRERGLDDFSRVVGNNRAPAASNLRSSQSNVVSKAGLWRCWSPSGSTMPDDPSIKDPKDSTILYSAMADDQPLARSAAETRLEEMIGDRLKQYYATRLSQPLPDRFLDLLNHLAKKEAE